MEFHTLYKILLIDFHDIFICSGITTLFFLNEIHTQILKTYLFAFPQKEGRREIKKGRIEGYRI